VTTKVLVEAVVELLKGGLGVILEMVAETGDNSERRPDAELVGLGVDTVDGDIEVMSSTGIGGSCGGIGTHGSFVGKMTSCILFAGGEGVLGASSPRGGRAEGGGGTTRKGEAAEVGPWRGLVLACRRSGLVDGPWKGGELMLSLVGKGAAERKERRAKKGRRFCLAEGLVTRFSWRMATWHSFISAGRVGRRGGGGAVLKGVAKCEGAIVAYPCCP